MAAAGLAAVAATGCSGRSSTGLPAAAVSRPAAAARSVGLSAGELPGYRAAHGALPTPRARAALDRCLGLEGDRVALGSTSFTRASGLQAQLVASQVVVDATSRQAARAAATLGSQAAPGCLEPFARKELGPVARRDGLALQASVAVAPLVFPVPAPGGAFAYRMALSTVASSRQTSIPVFVDLAGFVAGRALVELETVSAGALFPADLERRLLAHLVARARSRFA